MKEFYQHEMANDSKDMDQSFDAPEYGDTTLLTQRKSESRGIKKAPEQKAKDKVWENIMN